MSEKTTAIQEQEAPREYVSAAYADRRCIRRREVVGYILYDAAQNFNLNAQKETFVDSILGISLNLQSINRLIGGIWDVINDIIIGTVIDATRTRWGKFRPYLLLVSLPLAIISAIYWVLPVVFGGTSSEYFPKFIAYLLFEVLTETNTTFKDISRAGLLSTITPFPRERSRIIALTTYVCGLFSGAPSLIIEVLFDLVTNGIVTSAKKTSTQIITSVYVYMGPITAIVSGLVAMWFVIITRERVPQTEKRPSVIEGLKSVCQNRPVLLYILSEAIGSFGTGISTNSYYKWVLFFGTMETVAGIPSFFVNPIGFAKVGALQKRFSTKSLYMFSQSFAKSLYVFVFAFGMLGGKKNRFFTRIPPMMIITALWEIIFALFYGVRSVTSVEIRNECMDYCEWQHGFRSEATITVAKSVIQKIPTIINSTIQPQIKKLIGYNPDLYPAGLSQAPRTQFWIFAMATLFPAAITLLSIVPMFFYDIDKKKREQMYDELARRREEKAALEMELEG